MPKVGEDLPKEMRLAGYKRLKPIQQEFLNNYLYKDMTQTAAAREAGYKNAGVSAIRLLKSPVVAERLQELINKQHVIKEDITAQTKEQIANKLAEFKRLAESRMVNVTPDIDVIEHDTQNIEEDTEDTVK
jgi:phage terminase small subunit